jgi:L-arabinonolactonase
MKIGRVGHFRCKLGEGPVWDSGERALYLTDVLGLRIWRHDPASGEDTSWETPAPVGSFALRKAGGAVVAMGKGFHLFDFDSKQARALAEPEAGRDNVQFNDGKADRAGRFLAGTVQTMGPGQAAALYSASANGAVSKLDDGFRITNGPCWSPDGATFYFADSAAKRIFAYDYDTTSGTVANQRTFADTSGIEGIPDGATVDARGNVWSAQCDGGVVVCYDPSGKVLRTVEFPTAFVSSVMFGGVDLERLYVTSIDPTSLAGIAPDAMKRARPNEVGGALFVVDGLGVNGVPEHRYAG